MFHHQLISPQLLKSIQLKWISRLDGLVRIPLFDPIIADRAYVVVYSERRRKYELISFHQDDGTILWRFDAKNGGYGAPAILVDRIIMPTGFTDVTAVDTSCGRPLWTFSTQKRVRSAISLLGNLTVLSSGDEVIGLDHAGHASFKIRVPRSFLFGSCAFTADGRILTLGCVPSPSEGSVIHLHVLTKDSVCWSLPLEKGTVASSDTSGVMVRGDSVFLGLPQSVVRIDLKKQCILWRCPVSGPSHRSICLIKDEYLYATTIDGCIYAIEAQTGKLIWSRRLAETGIWAPASISGNWVFAVAGGVLFCMDGATGDVLDEWAVGHGPYSAMTIRENRGLLGGGDPPYYGLLFGFELGKECSKGIRCVVERNVKEPFVNELLSLHVRIDGIDEADMENVVLDSSSLGGVQDLKPYRINGKIITFLVAPSAGRLFGDYALPIQVATRTQGVRWSTVKIEFPEGDSLPSQVLLEDVPIPVQESPHFSGAACFQAALSRYCHEVSQEDLRDMADAVLAHSDDYSPFQLWRIISRRILSTGACSKAELPEFDVRHPLKE